MNINLGYSVSLEVDTTESQQGLAAPYVSVLESGCLVHRANDGWLRRRPLPTH